MVQKTYCDRCGELMEVNLDEVDFFDETFKGMSSKFLKKKTPFKEPQLCKKCKKGYDKIIEEANDKIDEYILEGGNKK